MSINKALNVEELHNEIEHLKLQLEQQNQLK